MEVVNAELALSVLKKKEAIAKFIMNQTTVVFFSATQQHRDIKTHCLSYEDDYCGNAAAGILFPDKVEIRFHKDYSDARVLGIWSEICRQPPFAAGKFGVLYYQGRALSKSNGA